MMPKRCLLLITIMLLLQMPRITSFLSSRILCIKKRSSARPLRAPSSVATSYSKYTKTLFDLHLPEGRCVGLELPEDDEDAALEGWSDASHWVHECLHPAEVHYGQQQPRANRKSFLLGRLAMRASLDLEHPCLKDEYGRPILPSSHLGSISHKGNVGVALTSPSSPMMGIGIDIERHASRRRSIAPRILTEREIQSLGQLETVSVDEEVLLRFSLKEAIYKAVNPLINQYVSFQEAEVTPLEDGTAICVWNLKSGAHTHFSSLTAHWYKLDDFFLTTARCTLLPSDDERSL